MVSRETINLKFMVLNAENLFLLMDEKPQQSVEQISESDWQKLSRSVYDLKPLKKCRELGQIILQNDPDILMLSEVGGEESLKNFNELFLAGKYSAALIEGNSDRNIDVGFLIRKGLPFYFDLFSNKNRSINYLYPHERLSKQTDYPIKGGKITESHKFSRDCVELRLFKNNSDQPFLIALLTHLKSPLDPERIDPFGKERRTAELKTVLEIYKDVSLKNSNVPIVVCGDFNGNASRHNTDDEFKDIYLTSDLEDVLEIASVPTKKRWTFFQIKSGIRTEGRQIDYAFLNPKAKNLLQSDSTKVLLYKNERGIEVEVPESLDEKLRMPSDHNPITFVLEKIEI